MHTAIRKTLTMLAAAALAGGALAQTAVDPGAGERVRLITDQTRQQTRAGSTFLELPKPAEYQHDAGGWVTITGLDLRDDDRSARTPDAIESVLIEDYRVWAAGELLEELRYYVRGRKLDFDFETRRGTPAPDLSIQEGSELDLAYLDWRPRTPLLVRAGRQFVRLGRGLVLSADLDGGLVEHAQGPWRHRVFAGRSLRRDPNIDTSVVGFDRGTQRRDFYFGESSHLFQSGTRAYGFLMVQQDDSRSLSAAQRARNFSYDTVHYGLGAEGRFHPLLNYFVEGIHQGGEALADVARDPRVDIDAYALLAGLLYYPRWKYRPLASLELGYGSGDPARSSVTATFGGKRQATDDENFQYFGAYDAGLALSPRLSNLTVLRLGYQFKPLPPEGRVLPDLLIGTKVSRYWKNEVNGVISDPLANRASHDVGWGADAFIGFRPLSDFSIFAQYGRFIPGDAYTPGLDDSGDRVLLNSTLSF